MPYHCQRCGDYTTSDKSHFKSHLGSTKLLNHNMGPFVCQVPGCNERSVRGDSDKLHNNHPGLPPNWVKDPNLVAALAAELAASDRPAPLAPHTTGPARSTAGPATSNFTPAPGYIGAPPYYLGPDPLFIAEPYRLTPPPVTTAAPSTDASPSTTDASSSTTTGSSSTATGSSSTTTTPFAIDPDLAARDAPRSAVSNNQNQGTFRGASAHGDEDDDDEDKDSTSASAKLEHEVQDILAHGEDEDNNASGGAIESSRDYLDRTGVSPLFTEAMKLLSFVDPPPEKPLEWTGKWLLARSREYEGVDEEEVKKEDKDEVKKEDDKGEEKEDEDEDKKNDQKSDEKEGETK